MNSQFVNRADAAEYLGVSASTLARWAMLRAGPRYHKVGGKACYKLVDLQAYVDSKCVEPKFA